MIHVELRGRLGNWLFQYAVARRLALQHRTQVCLVVRDKLSLRDPLALRVRRQLSALGVQARFALRAPRAQVVHREAKWGYDPEVLRLPDGALLRGYFQAPAYFEPIADALRGQLRAAAPGTALAERACEQRIRDAASVGVHVRRGDYLTDGGLAVCSIRYYDRAMAQMRQQVPSASFFVFTDDVAFCRAQACFDDATIVTDARSLREPVRDLRALSGCRHHIIANSTFSFWGAWLGHSAEQHVIAPSLWFVDPAMNEAALRDTLLPSWTRLAD